MKHAIVAHFDADNKWQENFLQTLSIINKVVDKTILVTTSQNIDNLPLEFSNVKLIKRPNIGYDFYSYKVGYNFALREKTCDGILLVNSSFYMINKEKFRKTLNFLISNGNKNKVIGLTASRQYFYHLQSYLIYIQINKRTKNILEKTILKVEPQNTKHEVIMKYEIGLSQYFINSKFVIYPLLARSNFINLFQIYFMFFRIKLNNNGFSFNTLKGLSIVSL